MGEGIGDDIALAPFLHAIVPDGAGRVQSLFDITGLQDLARSLSQVGPDTGETVRLELEPDR